MTARGRRTASGWRLSEGAPARLRHAVGADRHRGLLRGAGRARSASTSWSRRTSPTCSCRTATSSSWRWACCWSSSPGHIDLSVGSVAAFVGAVAAVLIVRLGWPVWAGDPGLPGRSAALIGAAQGYWIAYWRIPSFIVTLAGMLVFRGLTLWLLGGQNVGPFPQVRSRRSRPASSPTSSASARPNCHRASLVARRRRRRRC